MSQNKQENQKKIDTSDFDVTKYEVKNGEEELYHIKVTKGEILYDGKGKIAQGEKPVLQKMKKSAFKHFEKTSKRMGYKIDILHNPED